MHYKDRHRRDKGNRLLLLCRTYHCWQVLLSTPDLFQGLLSVPLITASMRQAAHQTSLEYMCFAMGFAI